MPVQRICFRKSKGKSSYFGAYLLETFTITSKSEAAARTFSCREAAAEGSERANLTRANANGDKYDRDDEARDKLAPARALAVVSQPRGRGPVSSERHAYWPVLWTKPPESALASRTLAQPVTTFSRAVGLTLTGTPVSSRRRWSRPRRSPPPPVSRMP